MTDISDKYLHKFFIYFRNDFKNLFYRPRFSNQWVEEDLGATELAKKVGERLDVYLLEKNSHLEPHLTSIQDKEYIIQPAHIKNLKFYEVYENGFLLFSFLSNPARKEATILMDNATQYLDLLKQILQEVKSVDL